MLPKKLKAPVQSFPRGAKTVFNDRFVTVKAHENNLKHIRLGILINKHVSPSSVKRNYLRRQFFSCLAEVIKNKTTKRGVDLLIITKTPIMALTREELKVSLENYGGIIQHSSI
ncbi:MAG TPA: ribonuclease P protein component [Candidatus Paceibacterota bacterium]|nr:ribonuclease P protein component [Candidatus Paceibacterota bacterium]